MRISILLFFTWLSVTTQAQPEKLVVMFTGDLNAQLNGVAPESEYSPKTTNDDKTFGGYARITSVFKSEKAKANCPTITLDIGDFLIGSLFSSLEAESGFQLSLMQEMGYDAVSIGNHDFDYGQQYLADAISNANDNSQIPPILLANIAFDKTSYADNDLALLYVNDIIKSYQILDCDGLKFGLISIIGNNELSQTPNMKPITGTDPIKTTQKFVDLIKKREKVDHIIVISHAELKKNKNGSWAGDNIEIATKVKGIDLIICPNGKYVINEPIIINKIPVVQARSNGKYISKVELIIKEDKAELSNYKNILIDDNVLGDISIMKRIEEQEQRVENELLSKHSFSYCKPLAETDFPLTCKQHENSNLGNLAADALHYYLNKIDIGKTDVAVVSNEMICNNIPKGKQWPADIFRSMPKGISADESPGYPITKFYLSSPELKSLMELLYIEANDNEKPMYYTGGIRVKYNKNGSSLKKVSQIDLFTKTRQYITINLNNKDLYSVAINTETANALLKTSKGKVKIKPKDETGNELKDFSSEIIDINPLTTKIDPAREWIALMFYMNNFKDIDGNNIPDVPVRYNTVNQKQSNKN